MITTLLNQHLRLNYFAEIKPQIYHKTLKSGDELLMKLSNRRTTFSTGHESPLIKMVFHPKILMNLESSCVSQKVNVNIDHYIADKVLRRKSKWLHKWLITLEWIKRIEFILECHHTRCWKWWRVMRFYRGWWRGTAVTNSVVTIMFYDIEMFNIQVF